MKVWTTEVNEGTLYLHLENTHHRGKYHFMADLLFDWFGFDQTSKTVVHLTEAKQLNPSNISNR